MARSSSRMSPPLVHAPLCGKSFLYVKLFPLFGEDVCDGYGQLWTRTHGASFSTFPEEEACPGQALEIILSSAFC